MPPGVSGPIVGSVRRVLGYVVAGLLTLGACGGQRPLSEGLSPGPTRTVTTTVAATSSSAPATPTARATSGPPAAPTTPALLTTGSAVVAVSVATVWRDPSSPRPVDGPALGNPALIRQWLSAMTTDQRRGLAGRVDTQVLLGQGVQVLSVSGGWARVVVPEQPTPLDVRGYPGYIPARQLVRGSHWQPNVTVAAARTWIRTGRGAPLVEVSFGSLLTGDGPDVTLPDGRTGLVDPRALVPGQLRADPESLVASAREFLGVDYLWAGTSAFGPDCSGLMSTVFAAHGVVIPRDADAQAGSGRAVSAADLRPGDLVFFARNGVVHHVGMYVGNGGMLHAPQSGAVVTLTSLSQQPYASEYAGARRYLP